MDWIEEEKGTIEHTEEDKYGLDWFLNGWFYGWFESILHWTEESKDAISYDEEEKSEIFYDEESKGTIDWDES